jgi:peptidoglycan/LPS O-acetylase OafA/YrhL
LIGLGTFLFLLGGLHLKFFEAKVLAPLCFSGKLSYGIYLLHGVIFYFCWPYIAGKNEIFSFLIFSASAIVTAFISYQFFEEPLNRWIRSSLTGKKQRITSSKIHP